MKNNPVAKRLDEHFLVIVQPVLPHYRVPLFKILSNDPILRSIIICGHSVSNLDSVATDDVKRIDVRNHFLWGNRLVFQKLPLIVYSAPVVIMEFNPRVLSNYPVVFWRTITRRPFVFWGHGISPRPDSPTWIVHLRRVLAHLADALILYSENGRQDFINLGVPPTKLFVAPNTIDVDRIWKIKNSLLQGERDQIIYIGRLIPAKKPELLLKAFNSVHDQLPKHIGLTIIGDGPEREKLEQLAREGGAFGKITFTGELTEEDEIAPYMMRALISVSPGYIGLSALHSLAYGVPLLVAQNEPHSPEIEVMKPEKTGKFYSPSTPEALAGALVEMLSNSVLMAQMSANALESIRTQFALENMVNAFRAAFQYVLKVHDKV